MVKLVGELDLDRKDRFSDAVAAILSEQVDVIEIDAGGLTFADSSALQSLLMARQAAAETGATLQLSRISPQLERVIEIAGLTEVLGPLTPDGS